MRRFSKALKPIIAASAVAFTAQAAHAETITVEGVYASNVDIPPEVELILIDRFQGDLGQDMELALTSVLGNVYIEGQPYFDLITPLALENARVEIVNEDGSVTQAPLTPDADFRGTVRSEVIERRVEPKRERECVKRDADDKCIERREVKIECRELSVRVDPRLILTSARGRELYSQTETRIAAKRFCADSDYVPSSLEMENELINALASEIRHDLAPVERRQGIRVMERRKDLRKEDRKPFRAAVKATDDNVDAACAGFEALEAANPAHISVLFNIGLCHESIGELDLALDYYSRALVIDPGRDYPTGGIRRVRSRMRAEEHIAAREAL